MMTMDELKKWCLERVNMRRIKSDCRASETVYINHIEFENGETYDFQDVEGQGITIKINGTLVYQE